MGENRSMNGDEASQAQRDLLAHLPTWLGLPEVTFLDVLRSRATGDPHLLSVVSLKLALRGVDLAAGGSLAVVPAPVKNVPPRIEMTRLLATWTNDGQPGRGQIYVLVGRSLLLEQAKRLGGRAGLPWLVFWGTDTGGRVSLLVGSQVEDLGHFSEEVVIDAIARGVGVESLNLEMRAQNWIEAMMAARFGVTSPVVQTETVP